MMWIWGIFCGIVGACCYYFGYENGCKVSEDLYRTGKEWMEKSESQMAEAAELLEKSSKLNDKTSALIEQQKADNKRFYEEVNARIKLLQEMEGEYETGR